MTTTSMACSSSAIPYPTLFGAEFFSMEAHLVQNFSRSVPSGFYPNHGAINITDVSFCNVTMSYTHPGQNDNVVVQTYLPIDTWNGRFQMVGGGGWQAGLYYPSIMAMTAAMGEGYSTISTNAGLGSSVSPDDWALLSPGNVNLYLLQNLASTSLNDASIIGKAITESFYGEPPKYSYFTGCSQGGRQGLQLAQRYPDAFDGIASSAPAIYLPQFFMADTWPSIFMRNLGEYPPSCEIKAITDAVLEACDGIDGLVDGIIGDPSKCDFDTMSVVGKTFNCSNFGTMRQVSEGAAIIVTEIFSALRKTDNSSLWYGPNKGSALSGSTTDTSMIPTTCSANETCVAADFAFANSWLKYFVMRNASADISHMTRADFQKYFHLGVQEYDSMIGTSDTDLSEFKARGGKILGYHGLADSLIPTNNTLKYYDAVTELDPEVHDFYRMFLAPGLSHCFGGNGPYPDETFDVLRKWVEEGVVPDTLNATSIGTESVINRPLCAYPEMQYWNGSGDGTTPEGFYCA